MKKFKFPSLSIRSQIILMMLGTIVVVQSAVLYGANFMKEKYLEDVVSGHFATTIRIIRAAVALLPYDQRSAFITKVSNGKWRLWSRQLPQNPHHFDRYGNLRFGNERLTIDRVMPSDRPTLSPYEQIFPNLHEPRKDSSFTQNMLRPRPQHPRNMEFPAGDVRNDLRSMINRINLDLGDGTRVGLLTGATPLMYISLEPELNIFSNTLIKEWLVIPLDTINPKNEGYLIAIWLGMTSLLLVLAGYFAWRITTPLMRLSQSADQLARGIHSKVVPSGPYETRALGIRFNAMLSSLEQAKTVQQTLLAGLPHDLKGPLARMRLRVEMSEENESQKGMLKDVHEMQNIIEQFISYVRGSDPDRYNFVRLHINQWLEERVNNWQSAGTPVSLKSMSTQALHISADTLALGRILDNLIGNALKHGQPPVEISLEQEDHFALISVEDHGQGIPEERREEALRAFSRLDTARTKTGSVGLGLALVETITHAHNGELNLTHATTGGLRVEIRFPLLSH